MRSLLLAAALAGAAGQASAQAAAPCVPAGFATAAERHLAAVVEVLVLRKPVPAESAEAPELFTREERSGSLRSFSSGFFIDDTGHALASAHSVADAAQVWLQTGQGRRLRAEVVGVDRAHDVALLKADARGTPAVPLEPIAAVRPGQWVFALGSPFGLRRTITAGIVSAYPRYMHGSGTAFVQTDAALNPGSSGSPLFDAHGLLVGMGMMVLSDSGVYEGVSLVLPAADLVRIARRLRAGLPDPEVALGLSLQPLEEGLDLAFGVDREVGALVTRVSADSRAWRAGLRAGDVLIGLRRGERLGYEALRARFAEAVHAAPTALQVWRGQSLLEIELPPVPSPARRPDGSPGHDRESGPEPRLGMVLLEWSPVRGSRGGLQVDGSAGPALLAGVEAGDRILAVNGTPVSTLREFDAALAALPARPVVALLLLRDGAVSYVPVWLSPARQ